MRQLVVSLVALDALYPAVTSNAAYSSMRTAVRLSPRPTSPVVDSPSMIEPLSLFSRCIDVRLTCLGRIHLGWCLYRKSSFQKRLFELPGLST